MFKKFGIMLMLMFALIIVGAPSVSFADTGSVDTGSFSNAPTNLTNPGTEVSGSPVGKLGSWVASQLMYVYALLVAVVAIVFVVKHEYSKLVAFLVIAVIVAIPIFAPNAIPQIAKAIAGQL